MTAAAKNNTVSTVPSSTNEEDVNNDTNSSQRQHSNNSSPPSNLSNINVGQQPLSAFSSPSIPTTTTNDDENNHNTTIRSNDHNLSSLLSSTVALQPTISSVSHHTTATSTPMLNGENIMLSFSNDTTPTTVATGGNNNNANNNASSTPYSGRSPSSFGLQIVAENNNVMSSGSHRQQQADEMMDDALGEVMIQESSDMVRSTSTSSGNNNNTTTLEDYDEDGDEEPIMEISPISSSFQPIGVANVNANNNAHAHSPPPESIHSEQLTTLSPPPLSLKSTTSGPAGHYYYAQPGPPPDARSQQSLFSRGDNNNNINHRRLGSADQLLQQQHLQQPPPPTVTSAGGNTAQSKKNRPPLPPRWAIGNNNNPPVNTTTQSGHHPHHPVSGGDMVDVVPSHLPPPKHIGMPLNHRRVFSSGDASFLSNLTDPDVSADDVVVADHDTFPPMAVAVPSGLLLPPTVKQPPLPKNPISSARKRGVSWDFEGGGVVGNSAFASSLAASHTSESDSLNRYKNEEEAAFDTLGILQPILPEGDDNAAASGGVDDSFIGDLLQPILIDDEPMIVDLGDGAAHPLPSSDLPPPPPPPPEQGLISSNEKVVLQKHKSTMSSRSLMDSSKVPSSKSVSIAKKSEKKDHTQFEDEAEMAILEALSAYNMSVKPGDHINVESDDDDNKDDDAPDVDGGEESSENNVPTQVLPEHRKDVSALTVGFSYEVSPNLGGSFSRKRGESIFEDSAWTDEYDAQGRIDGTLPEEKDAKLVGEETPQVELTPTPKEAVASVAPPAPKPPLMSKLIKGKRSDGSGQVTGILNNAEKDDDSTSSKHEKKVNPEASKIPSLIPKDPTAETGLRHRRTKTIAAKNMAEELAQIAALHSEDVDFSETKHQRSKTAMTLQTIDGHGTTETNNLLAGMAILAQHDDESEDNSMAAQHDYPTDTGNNPEDDDDIGDHPHDVETGNANNIATQNNTPNRRRSSLGKRSEMFYHFKIWYHDLIRPKRAAFIKGATHSICFVILPLLSIAFILYYGAGNPMAGSHGVEKEALAALGEGSDQGWVHASWSWWVLFFVRQAFLLSCVKAGEVVSIDIFALRTPIFLKVVGSFATLMIVQARGWPYIMTFWAIADFCFLFGSHKFANHVSEDLIL